MSDRPISVIQLAQQQDDRPLDEPEIEWQIVMAILPYVVGEEARPGKWPLGDMLDLSGREWYSTDDGLVFETFEDAEHEMQRRVKAHQL